MLHDAELAERVRQAQALIAALIYEAARSAPYSTIQLEIPVEQGKPTRMVSAVRRSDRFFEPANAATDAPR